MGINIQNLKLTVGAIALIVVNSLPLSAEQDVNDLLEQLKSAEPSEVAPIERAIKLVWSKSGSTAMDLLLRRGRDAMEVEDWPAAIDHFTALTDHAPDFAEGWHARATAYFRAGLHGPALVDLEHTLALNPDHYEAIFGLGAMMMDLDRLTFADKAFRHVLRLHPTHESATKALEQLERQGIGRTL
ncbi:MAG: tetratricopeptide repeat protein [Ascidiaceihabitans sp.]|nr:tetratricopeptide repeat protein [Ascidiaceihabitans sp.]